MIPIQQALFLIVLTLALALFVSGKLRVDVSAILTLLALVITGILEPNQALAGFSSEPAIIVASVFVLSAGLSATGVTDRIGQWIGRAAGSSEWRALLVIMPTVALLAAFSHHLMVTAMMLPIIMRFARDRGLPASRLLMPMSLSASLGTTLTLFSAPAFLLASDLLQRQVGRRLGIFSLTPIGATLVLAGVLYVMVTRWLLPRRQGTSQGQDYLRLDRYYTELVVTSASTWVGRREAELRAHFNGRLELVERLHGGARVDDPHLPLRIGDILLVRASPDEIASVKAEPGLALNAIEKYGSSLKRRANAEAGETRLVQVVVGPGSEFSDKTVGQVDFLNTFGVLVVGLWRRESLISSELSQVRLRAGDLLVISGDSERYAELARHSGFLLMVPFMSTAYWRHRAPLALGIMLAVVVASASGMLAVPIVFLAGAAAMVLTRCVNIEQAYREIDVRVFVMIAGVIPLGTAMEKSGTAALLAKQILAMSPGWSALAMLAVMFAAAALLTQILSDAATVVLLGPIAVAIAGSLALPAEPFVVCTAVGAVASFLTPIGHHGNLLILGPGRYTFSDFLRVGFPLTLLIAALTCWLSQAIWLGGPLIPPQLRSLQWPF
jgi:di/tricarboxylate transporter